MLFIYIYATNQITFLKQLLKGLKKAFQPTKENQDMKENLF